MRPTGYREQFFGHRPSRRSMLRGIATGGAGLAAASVIGCGQGKRAKSSSATSGVNTPTAKQPKRGGTLVHLASSIGVFPYGFDPHVSSSSDAGAMLFFYQTLIRQNIRTYDPEPEIAQKWEQPSNTEYLFHLAPGVKWQNKPPANGRALTADDVVYSLNRVRTNDPKFINRSFLAQVDKIEAVNPATVRITTKVPDVSTLNSLGFRALQILAPEVVDRYGGKLTTAATAVGTGPFVITASDDVSATLVRNPDYWKPGLPYLDGVRLVFIKDDASAWAAFLAGQLDVTNVPGTEANKFFKEQSGKYYFEWYKTSGPYQLWQNTARKPFDDPRVTRALRLLIDHQEMISAWAEPWFGGGQLGSHLPTSLDSWDFSQAEYAQMLEWKQPKDAAVKEALALLSAAGFTKDNPLVFTHLVFNVPSIKPAAELLDAQYSRLGQGVVKVADFKLVDSATQQSLMVQGDFQVCGPSPKGSDSDPGTTLASTYHAGGSRNFGKYSDPTDDSLLDKQSTIVDVTQRKAAIKEILKYLIEHAPYVLLAALNELTAAGPTVKGLAPETQGSISAFQYENVWFDR